MIEAARAAALIISTATPTTTNAKGNAFGGGSIIPFAMGGVVTKPTYFPMANHRTGLMGEAGNEGILPLKRNKQGKLGVIASGGSGSVTNNRTIHMTVNTPDANSFRRSKRQILADLR